VGAGGNTAERPATQQLRPEIKTGGDDMAHTLWKAVAARALLTASLIYPAAASADSVADFYAGKSVFVIVGSGAGGGYDIYTRALARHWNRHIPGQPALVVQNMPGAGGITMMNHMANIAKADGTVVGAGFANTVIEPVFDKGAVTKYDSRQLNWIGSISPQQNACFTWHTNPVKTLEQARETPVIIATSGYDISAMSANVVNALLGTKFKIVMGYATAETTLAIERGEAEGTCLSSATLIAARPDWIREHKVNWLVVLNNKPDPTLPGVPYATQFARNDEDRAVLDLISSQLAMGRPFLAPPGVPPDRLQALRASFMETMKDPEFLAEAKKLEMIINPSDHTDMEKMINATYATPEPIVARAKSLIDATPNSLDVKK
jgi:tripartite-type tricarboxylate transporter receptor subunit TctC